MCFSGNPKTMIPPWPLIRTFYCKICLRFSFISAQPQKWHVAKFYFLVLGFFYQILSLNMSCQYIIILMPLQLLLTLCTVEQIDKETLLLASTIWLICTIFPERKQISRVFILYICLVYRKLKKNKSPLILLNVEYGYTKIFPLRLCKEINRVETLFLRYYGLNFALRPKIVHFYC